MIAIRGAITVDCNSKDEIRKSTIELFSSIMESNNIVEDDLVSIIFSTTKDLDKLYPAVAVREYGIAETPLFCVQEMNVEGSLKKCIRVMLHCDKEIQKKEVKHIYLKEAQRLRPDLIN